MTWPLLGELFLVFRHDIPLKITSMKVSQTPFKVIPLREAHQTVFKQTRLSVLK